MSLRDVASAGEKADVLIKWAKAKLSFVNLHGGDYDTLRELAGKPLADLTDANINTYFGVTLSAEAMASAKLILKGFEDDIIQGRAIADTLPPNDVS